MDGMGGNRVEELESQVNELQATIDGLTDELLECKERLEVLEEEVDPDMDIIEGGITRPSGSSGSSGSSESSTTNEPVEGSGGAADSDNTGGDETGDDSDANDIIVA